MQVQKERSKTTEKKATLAEIAKHPVRVECFMILAERVASPNELSRELGVPLARIAYHVRRVLDEQLGAVELVDEKQRRGAVEHFYRATERPFVDDEEWAAMPEADRRIVSRDILNRAIVDLAHSWETDTFDRRADHALIRFPMNVDEIGWQKLNQLNREMYEQALEIQADCNARMAESGEDGIQTMHLTTFFERGPLSRPLGSNGPCPQR